jgi:hypothetical protein
MTNAKATQTPLPSNWDPKKNKGKATAAEITHYQSIIRSLLYLMIGTCPDIFYAVMHLSQFSMNSSEDHYKAVLHICHYLAGTQDYKLVYSKTANKGLMAYTDSDWAADKIQHQSITGYFFKLANSIISWRSHAQKTVALSLTEAEYMAISDRSCQAVWIKTMLEELGIWLKLFPFMVTTKAPSSLPVTLCKRAILSTLTSSIIISVNLLLLKRLSSCLCQER